MGSLADSFLADLEDIEGSTSDVVMKIESSFTEPDFPSLLKDPGFTESVRMILCKRESTTLLHLCRSDEDYLLIQKCNELTPLIDAEVSSIHQHVCELYRKRFPELEQVLAMPMDYLRVVDRIGNSLEVGAVDFSDFLPNSVVVAISVIASTSSGVLLSVGDMQVVTARIRTALALWECKVGILEFLKNRMPVFAPNLSALLGPLLSAQLIAPAGGVQNLATMPSQNIESVGRRIVAGVVMAKESLIGQSDLVRNCVSEVRRRALRLVLGKTSLAARVDQFDQDKQGQSGARFRDFIENSLAKASAPPPARAIKPLAVPIEKPKNKRGGRRHRKMKENYGITEVQKKQNRVQFGAGAAQDYGELERGMLDVQTGHGRIRKGKERSSGGVTLSLAPAKSSTVNEPPPTNSLFSQ